MSGVESYVVARAGQLVWTRLLVCRIWRHCFVDLCGGRLAKGKISTVWPLEFCWEEAVPRQSLCPSSRFPCAGAQREWVYVSPKSIAGPLKWDTWYSYSLFCRPDSHWFLQPEVMRMYLLGFRTLSWVVWCGARIPCSRSIPSEFHPPRVGMGLSIHASVSTCLCRSYASGWIWLL